MQNLSEPAVLNLPSFITPNPSEPFVPGLSRICHPFPAILYAEPPRNRRAEPSRSFRVGFDPRIFFISRTYAYFHFSSDACFLFRLTPVFVVHPYARIRSYFRFSPNPAPLLPALLLLPSFILIPAFALISDFPPILSRFFRLYSCFCPSLYPHSLLFPIFPQSCPAFSGFTPVFALYPYTRIRSCFRFFLNPAPLFPVLLLFSSFIIPAFALIDIFTPYSFFLCFERLHKQADADMPARP